MRKYHKALHNSNIVMRMCFTIELFVRLLSESHVERRNCHDGGESYLGCSVVDFVYGVGLQITVVARNEGGEVKAATILGKDTPPVGLPSGQSDS
ncbi:hypothetical protein AKJ16_DCAP01239 [Drosera capensis]